MKSEAGWAAGFWFGRVFFTRVSSIGSPDMLRPKTLLATTERWLAIARAASLMCLTLPRSRSRDANEFTGFIV
jgi:hypothetical protein